MRISPADPGLFEKFYEVGFDFRQNGSHYPFFCDYDQPDCAADTFAVQSHSLSNKPLCAVPLDGVPDMPADADSGARNTIR